MNEYISNPSMRAFIFQGFVAVLPIVGSYIAYRWSRADDDTRNVTESLKQIGYHDHESETSLQHPKSSIQGRHSIKNYFWPLVLTSGVILVLYSMTHPFVILSGLWVGTLEELVNIFGVQDVAPIAIVAGRVLFWGWLGAYIYSFNLIFKRFMAYDLTPGVYVFAATRFILAWIIGSIVAVVIGTTGRTFMQSDLNMAYVFGVVFFIGFFPEQGLDWLTAFAKNRMHNTGNNVKETRLSDIEGLSIWQQARLQQEGIENVQNLANADIPSLIINTPFPVGQIIDWVDQAILLVYANGNNPKRHMYNLLEDTGIRCASDFLTASRDEANVLSLAMAISKITDKTHQDETKISTERLRTLRLAIQSATNIRVTSYYRWKFSMDSSRVTEATLYPPFSSVVGDCPPLEEPENEPPKLPLETVLSSN